MKYRVVKVVKTEVTREYLGQVTVSCPICNEVQLVDVYKYIGKAKTSGMEDGTYVWCTRCKSSFTVHTEEAEETTREKRRDANTEI